MSFYSSSKDEERPLLKSVGSEVRAKHNTLLPPQNSVRKLKRAARFRIHHQLTLSLPRVIDVKIPLQPHQKYCITQYRELGFSQLTQMKDDYTVLPILTTPLTRFLFRGWENVLFELGSNRVNMRGMYKADELWYKGARNEPVYSLNEFIRLSFNQALPRGELFYHQFSQLYICCGSGGEITKFEPLGILSTKTEQYYNYLIRPAEAVMEREQPRSRRNKDKIGGATLLTKTHFQTVMFNHACTDFWKLPKLCSHEACTDCMHRFPKLCDRKVVLRTNVAIAMCPLSPFLKPGHGWRVNFKADNISQWQDFRWSILVQSILYIHVHLTPSPFKDIPCHTQLFIKFWLNTTTTHELPSWIHSSI